MDILLYKSLVSSTWKVDKYRTVADAIKENLHL